MLTRFLLVCLATPSAFGADFDLLAGILQLDDLCIEVDAGESLAETFFERLHEVAVGAGKQAVQQFDH